MAAPGVWDQAPMQAARGAYRYRPTPKFRDTSTNPDNEGPKRLSTSHSHIQESAPVEQLPVLAEEEVRQHTPAAAEKVCNQDYRKICQFRRDCPHDRYAVPGRVCCSRCIRRERIPSVPPIKISLYFS